MKKTMKHILKFIWVLMWPWIRTLLVIPFLLLLPILFIAHEVVGAWIMAGTDEGKKRVWEALS